MKFGNRFVEALNKDMQKSVRLSIKLNRCHRPVFGLRTIRIIMLFPRCRKSSLRT